MQEIISKLDPLLTDWIERAFVLRNMKRCATSKHAYSNLLAHVDDIDEYISAQIALAERCFRNKGLVQDVKDFYEIYRKWVME